MIGFFDSGFGGVTVLKPVMDLLPEYDYIYLGDNARAPYGNHSAQNIIKFSLQAVEYLISRGVKLIVFACNTASSTALEHIQNIYKDNPEIIIIGVLIPVANHVSALNHGSSVGIVGTKATINSNAYEIEINKINKNLKIFSKACPLLVPFIEENWHNTPEAKSVLKKYLMPLKNANINKLVLACTHYPIMEKQFKKIMGNKVKLITAGDITAKYLQNYLSEHPELEKQRTKNSKRIFLTTDDPKNMQNFIEKNFNMKISPPEKITYS